MNFVEKPFKRKRIYKGKAVHFSVDYVTLPNRKKAIREYMEHPGAVTILPFLDKDHIILVKQYRYPVRKLIYELPAGKLDHGEGALSCVKRELAEETGYRARSIKKLVSFWPTPAFSDEIIHIYAAKNLAPASISPDEDEFIQTKVISFRQALKWIKTGRIQDAKTIIALLYWCSMKAKND